MSRRVTTKCARHQDDRRSTTSKEPNDQFDRGGAPKRVPFNSTQCMELVGMCTKRARPQQRWGQSAKHRCEHALYTQRTGSRRYRRTRSARTCVGTKPSDQGGEQTERGRLRHRSQPSRRGQPKRLGRQTESTTGGRPRREPRKPQANGKRATNRVYASGVTYTSMRACSTSATCHISFDTLRMHSVR